jgi:hypothetical protein
MTARRPSGHRHEDLEGCKAALDRSSKCTWPGCGQTVAGLSISKRDFDDVPLCSGHMFEVWRLCRDSANRRNNRDKTILVAVGGTLKKIEQPVSTVGWVYYLLIDGHIKIGYASKLLNRLRAYPPTAGFLYAHRGTKADEKVAHSMNYLHRATGREWFTAHADVYAWIEQQQARYGPASDPRVKPTHDAAGVPLRSAPIQVFRG